MLAGARPCGTVDFGASSHFLYLEGFKTYFFFSLVGVLVLVFDLQNFVIKASLRYLFLYGDFHLGGCIPKLFWLCLKTTQNPPLRHSHINKMEKQQSSPRTHHAPASETAGAGGDGSSGPCTSSPALDTPGGSSPSRSSGSSVQSCESSGSKRRHQGNMAPQPPSWPLVHNALDTLALALGHAPFAVRKADLLEPAKLKSLCTRSCTLSAKSPPFLLQWIRSSAPRAKTSSPPLQPCGQAPTNQEGILRLPLGVQTLPSVFVAHALPVPHS